MSPLTKLISEETTQLPRESTADGGTHEGDLCRHAAIVFEQLRDAMSELVQAVPGTIRRAVDLQRSLGVPGPLAWRVFKIARVTDRFDVVNYIPGSGEIQTLVEAARKKRVSVKIIRSVLDALGGCNELLHEHAGSVASLKTMVASLRPDKTVLLNEQIRKRVFQGNSLLWGKQVDVSVACFIIQPDAGAGVQPSAGIFGQVGFHQTRTDVVHEIPFSGRIDRSAGGLRTEISPQILADFSSPNLDVQICRDDSGTVQGKIRLQELGRRGAINFFQLFTANSTYFGGTGRICYLMRLPSAMVHLDLMVPSTPERRQAEVVVYGRSTHVSVEYDAYRDEDIMPVDVSATSLGACIDMPEAPDIPRYSEMVRSVLTSQDWYGNQFDVFRCRLAYPILHSLLTISVKLNPSNNQQA